MVLNQDYEQGTNATTITIANSGGTGENGVDTAVIATGNTEKYDTTVTLTSGSVSLKHTVVSTSNGNCYWAWTTTLGTQTQYYIRGYFRFDTANTIICFQGLNGSTSCWIIAVSSTGHIQIKSGVTTLSTGTTTIGINTTFRLEAFIDHTNGALTCRIFIGGNKEGSTPDETLSYTGQTMGGQANDNALRIGPQNIINLNMWTDAIRFDTANWIGALNPPAGGVLGGMSITATSTVSGTVVERHKISGVVAATSSVSGTIQKPGTTVVPSTYGVGVYGQAIYGGSGAPPPTGLTGIIRATATVRGAISRAGSGGGIYTPPYTPPIPPPTPPVGTFDTFAEAVYEGLNVDVLTS